MVPSRLKTFTTGVAALTATSEGEGVPTTIGAGAVAFSGLTDLVSSVVLILLVYFF